MESMQPSLRPISDQTRSQSPQLQCVKRWPRSSICNIPDYPLACGSCIRVLECLARLPLSSLTIFTTGRGGRRCLWRRCHRAPPPGPGCEDGRQGSSGLGERPPHGHTCACPTAFASAHGINMQIPPYAQALLTTCQGYARTWRCWRTLRPTPGN